MPRKQMFEGGTKNRIVEVAGKMFFENGFDGTGIRAVMKEVGANVGAFYYYYKTKDELFTDVLVHFCDRYDAEFERIAAAAEKKPHGALLELFDYVQKITREFREKYADNMHFTVRYAIREATLTKIEPYVERIVDVLVANGAKPVMDTHLTAVFLSHGCGSTILHEDSDWAEEARPQVIATVKMLLGIDDEVQKKIIAASV